MTVYQCELRQEEPGVPEYIFLSEIPEPIIQSPFEHVIAYNNAEIKDDMVIGTNYEGRQMPVCEADEYIIFD